MPQLVTGFLDPSRIDNAYPLVQLCRPGVSLESWRRFARERVYGNELNGRLGFLIAEDQFLQTISGLAECSWVFDLMAKKVLRIENLMISGILSCQERAIAAVLIRAAEKLAGEKNCEAVELHIPTVRNVSQALRDIDHEAANAKGDRIPPRGQLTHYTYCRVIA